MAKASMSEVEIQEELNLQTKEQLGGFLLELQCCNESCDHFEINLE